MHITLSFLVLLEACAPQRTIFADTFPEGIHVEGEPDPETLAKIAEFSLDVEWLAERVLTAAAYVEYAKVRDAAYAEYAKVRAPAYAEYEKATAAAYVEYAKVRDAAYAEYAKVRAPAYAEYEKVRAPAYAEYEKVRAPALWRLLANPVNHTPIVCAYFASGVPPVAEGAPS